jgi:hypothetical protein
MPLCRIAAGRTRGPLTTDAFLIDARALPIKRALFLRQAGLGEIGNLGVHD